MRFPGLNNFPSRTASAPYGLLVCVTIRFSNYGKGGSTELDSWAIPLAPAVCPSRIGGDHDETFLASSGLSDRWTASSDNPEGAVTGGSLLAGVHWRQPNCLILSVVLCFCGPSTGHASLDQSSHVSWEAELQIPHVGCQQWRCLRSPPGPWPSGRGRTVGIRETQLGMRGRTSKEGWRQGCARIQVRGFIPSFYFRCCTPPGSNLYASSSFAMNDCEIPPGW